MFNGSLNTANTDSKCMGNSGSGNEKCFICDVQKLDLTEKIGWLKYITGNLAKHCTLWGTMISEHTNPTSGQCYELLDALLLW